MLGIPSCPKRTLPPFQSTFDVHPPSYPVSKEQPSFPILIIVQNYHCIILLTSIRQSHWYGSKLLCLQHPGSQIRSVIGPQSLSKPVDAFFGRWPVPVFYAWRLARFPDRRFEPLRFLNFRQCVSQWVLLLHLPHHFPLLSLRGGASPRICSRVSPSRW